MQRIWAVVPGQLILGSVEGEFAISNAITVAADDGAEIWLVVEVAIQSVKAERHVSRHTFVVGNSHRNYDSAVIHSVDFNSTRVRDGVEVNRALWDGAKCLFPDHVRPLRRRWLQQNESKR